MLVGHGSIKNISDSRIASIRNISKLAELAIDLEPD